jgi:hypothetical protein
MKDFGFWAIMVFIRKNKFMTFIFELNFYKFLKTKKVDIGQVAYYNIVTIRIGIFYPC